MKQGEDPEPDETPSEHFTLKIAHLVLKGRFGRAHREIHRFNSGKRAKLKILPPEQAVAWARQVLQDRAQKKFEMA